MREVILDTETTGLDPNKGHRITEIGCVELIDHVPTGRVFQVYINPERDVPPEAQAICGLPTEFFFDKPKFNEVVDSFLDFIQDDVLVIHNASFDIKFLNSELERAGKRLLSMDKTIDTLQIARKMFPGSPANLDALCKRFNVDLSKRDKHGALLDCQLLAEVYINLLGGKQSSLSFALDKKEDISVLNSTNVQVHRPQRSFKVILPSNDELKAHDILINNMKEPIWKKYQAAE